MTIFAAVDDAFLGRGIDRAVSRVVYVAPGVGKATAEALVRAINREPLSVTTILDSDEDAYRIGYGDASALATLHEATAKQGIPLRRQPGLRIGILVLDDEVVIWAPTARSVEQERTEEQPNAVVLSGAAAEKVAAAVGAEGSPVLPNDAEIGKEPMRPEETSKTVANLKANPPAPFDLARKTRVFSTRFQFVEFEVRGAEWTQRQIKLSSLLVNADMPEELQDVLETRVRPFQTFADIAFPVPLLVNGRPAYERDGTRMLVPATQAEIERAWTVIRGKYLRQLKGFGWLINRHRLQAFEEEKTEFEKVLKSWVEAFRAHAAKDEDRTVRTIVDSIAERVRRAPNREQVRHVDLTAEVQRGLQRLRVIEPRVRIVLKNVSWESSRDDEFLEALANALPEDELEGWFEEFTAVRQRPTGVA